MKRFLVVILALLLALPLTACQSAPAQSGTFFYYLRTETSFDDSIFAPEGRDLSSLGGDLTAMLDLYCAGPVQDGLESPLPPGTSVRSHTLTQDTLTLHFDAGLAQLEGIDLTIAAGCLARTFLPLTGATKLTLTAEGALLNSQTALELTLADLELRDNSLDLLHQNVTVYYSDQEQRYLIGQELSVAPYSPEELPLTLLELLMTPPSGNGLRTALPEGTRFLSAVAAEGLCTVEVSSEFETLLSDSQTGQLLTLMSVVNTLTELENIDRVEFLVDGNLLIRYGSISITEPLRRDERCIGPVRTGLGEQDATLYLAHGPESRLLAMPVRLERTGTASDAELILRHLLRDTSVNGIGTCISPQTRLLSVRISDGTCIVDLSEEYLLQPESLLGSGRVIAASLCTLEDIDRVQILVNGAIPADLDSGLFGLLTPNADWFL